MKRFLVLAPIDSPKKPVFRHLPVTKIKSTEMAKFLRLSCRRLGACRRVNDVSFSTFVAPIYAAFWRTAPAGLQEFLNVVPVAIQFSPQVFPVVARSDY